MDLLAGWAGGHHHWPGLLFGAVMVAITIAPPYTYVLYGVHRGRFTDRHLGDRRQRVLPLLLATAASVAGIAILGLAAAASAVLVICAGIFHGWPLPTAPVVAVIAWARVRLKDRTVAQVVAGAAFGAAIALIAVLPLAGRRPLPLIEKRSWCY